MPTGKLSACHFTDGIVFEVLPAFLNKDDSYTHADSNNGGSWKTTNPRPEIAAMKSRNIDVNANLVPLCRMMRAWKSQWSVPISGILIDTLAYQFIIDWEHRMKSYFYYDFMCRDFFAFLVNQNPAQIFWRAPGSGRYVYAGGAFQPKAKRCYNLAVEAIAHQQSGQDWSARQKWREILGTAFPY